MDALLGTLPQLAGLIEKGGVVGVMLIVCVVLVYEIRRGRTTAHALRGQLQEVYTQRDKALLALMKVKTICEAKNIKVDFSDVEALLPKVAAPPAIGGVT